MTAERKAWRPLALNMAKDETLTISGAKEKSMHSAFVDPSPSNPGAKGTVALGADSLRACGGKRSSRDAQHDSRAPLCSDQKGTVALGADPPPSGGMRSSGETQHDLRATSGFRAPRRLLDLLLLGEEFWPSLLET